MLRVRCRLGLLTAQSSVAGTRASTSASHKSCFVAVVPLVVALRAFRDGTPLAVRAAARCRLDTNVGSHPTNATPTRSYREELRALQACLSRTASSGPYPSMQGHAETDQLDDALEGGSGLRHSIGGNLLRQTGLEALMAATATSTGAGSLAAQDTKVNGGQTSSSTPASWLDVQWAQQAEHVLLAAAASALHPQNGGAGTPIYVAIAQIEACLRDASTQSDGPSSDRGRLHALHISPPVWVALFDSINASLVRSMRASTKEGEAVSEGDAGAGPQRSLSRQQYVRERCWETLRSGYGLVRLFQLPAPATASSQSNGGGPDAGSHRVVLRAMLRFASNAADAALATTIVGLMHDHGLLREADAVTAAAAFSQCHRADLCHWVFSMLPPPESTQDMALREARCIAALAAAADANPLVAVDLLRQLERLLEQSSIGAMASDDAVDVLVGAVVSVLGAIARSVSVAAPAAIGDGARSHEDDSRPLDMVDGLLTTILTQATTTVAEHMLVHEAVLHVLACCCIVTPTHGNTKNASLLEEDGIAGDGGGRDTLSSSLPLRSRVDATVAKLLQRSARAELSTNALVDAILCEALPTASLEKLEASVKMGIAPCPSAINAVATRLLVGDAHPSYFFSALRIGTDHHVCNERAPAMLATGMVHLLHRMASTGTSGPTPAQVRDAISECVCAVDAHHAQGPQHATSLCSITMVALQQLRCWAWACGLPDSDAAVHRLDVMLEDAARFGLRRWHRRRRGNNHTPARSPGQILSHSVVATRLQDASSGRCLQMLDDNDLSALAQYCTSVRVQWDVAASALHRIVDAIQRAQQTQHGNKHVVLLVDQVAALDFCWTCVWARALPLAAFDADKVADCFRSLDVCGGVASAYVRRMHMEHDGAKGRTLDTVSVGLGQALNEPGTATLRALAQSAEPPLPPLALLRDPAMVPDTFERALPRLMAAYCPTPTSEVPWLASPSALPSSDVFVMERV